ncbi:MAG: M28 family peptidase, partial [Bacteroidia bacterium]
TANSDHYWFTTLGIPSVFIYTLGGSKAYHDIYDTAANLTLAKFEEVYKLFIQVIN